MSNTYDLGDLVRCAGVFTDASGNLVDPTVVKASVQTPAGIDTTYTYGTDVALVRDSAGAYHLDVSATSAGRWYYRLHSTGIGQASGESYFDVSPSQFS